MKNNAIYFAIRKTAAASEKPSLFKRIIDSPIAHFGFWGGGGAYLFDRYILNHPDIASNLIAAALGGSAGAGIGALFPQNVPPTRYSLDQSQQDKSLHKNAGGNAGALALLLNASVIGGGAGLGWLINRYALKNKSYSSGLKAAAIGAGAGVGVNGLYALLLNSGIVDNLISNDPPAIIPRTTYAVTSKDALDAASESTPNSSIVSSF